MKKIVLAVICVFVLIACSEDSYHYYNPYLPDTQVSLSVNLNLPTYAPLNYVNNSVIEYSQGYNGVIIHHSPVGFVAYEATCSNHTISPNSALNVRGEIATCNHCDRQYFLLTGQPTSETETSQYHLKPFHVNQQGNILRITNF